MSSDTEITKNDPNQQPRDEALAHVVADQSGKLVIKELDTVTADEFDPQAHVQLKTGQAEVTLKPKGEPGPDHGFFQ